MLSQTPRAQPLRLLVRLEFLAMLSAFAIDVIEAAAHFSVASSALRDVAAYVVFFMIAACALFAIPHAPNRRWALIGIAIAGIFAVNLQPMSALAPSVLLVILAARLTFAFGFRGSVVAWTVALANIAITAFQAYLPHPTSEHLAAALGYVLALSLLLTFLFGMIWIIWLYAQKAAAAERSRIAFDLHDSLGHALTTLTVQLQSAQRLRVSDPHKADTYVERAANTVAELLGDVRETVAISHTDISPPPLSLFLERLHANFVSTHSIEVIWNVEFAGEPTGRVSMALYRVLQEALTNIARHADAKHVEVNLQGSEGGIELRVRDDGRGFSPREATGHGLTFMRARIESLGGTLTVTTNEGRGTTLCARVPHVARV